MLALVPYIVAIIASLLIVKLPKGKDLAVPIFLIPWVALGIEVGVSVRVSEALMFLITMKYLLNGNFRLNTFPGLGYLMLYLLLALIAAVVTIEFGPEVPPFAGGGVMRNGYGRVVTTLLKTTIFLGFLAAMISSWKNVNVPLLIKAYIISCVILAIIGLLQLVIFTRFGIDIVPIGLLDDAQSTRRGTVLISGEQVLRISSFGGEPKGLGQSLAIGLCLLLCFYRRLNISIKRFYVLGGILLIATIFTNSTSAFITFFMVTGLMYFFGLKSRSFSSFNIQIVFIVIASSLIGLYYFTAATTDTLAPKTFRYISSFADSLLFKVTDRVKLDDTDALIMESFVGDYFGLVFGRGLGLVHHYAYTLIPSHAAYYLEGAIIVPKSGIANYVGNLGLLGVLLICCMFSRFVPSRNLIGPYRSLQQSKFIGSVQALCFGLFAAHLLRLYTTEIIWVIFALSYILTLQMRLNNKIQFKSLDRIKNLSNQADAHAT